ncbi:hypothetical protein BDY19DRAFT_949358 [Irpex rosettiformis]|uniref:Uncharacterized protein n=1 Tax=Irpex rosettiformis TaxID=378272 RepID=A0ACB8U425_9APHY|nr:hypothetical protein BDY19DRAFT_949358 [Irpex rosettiformis]
MTENTTRKRKSDRSVRNIKQPSEKQRILAKKSVRDHFAIIAVALIATLLAYVYRTYFAIQDIPLVREAFEVRNLLGKGKGIVALRNIQRGELLLKEKPLFVVPSAISHTSPGALILSSLARLTHSQRQSFYNLSYVHLPENLEPDTPQYNDELALAIFQTNAVSAGSDGVGIFPRMARLNHGCSKAFNVVYSWRENERAIVVHALKDIKQGQELLTTYTDTKRPRSERRQLLEAHYGFTCQCSVCSLLEAESRKSDERLSKMATLYSQFKSWAEGAITGREAIDIVNKIWQVGEEEGYHSERGQLAADAVYIAASHSDGDAVRAWAQLSHQWYSLELGLDSEQAQAMAGLRQHPEQHGRWGAHRPELVGGPILVQ